MPTETWKPGSKAQPPRSRHNSCVLGGVKLGFLADTARKSLSVTHRRLRWRLRTRRQTSQPHVIEKHRSQNQNSTSLFDMSWFGWRTCRIRRGGVSTIFDMTQSNRFQTAQSGQENYHELTRRLSLPAQYRTNLAQLKHLMLWWTQAMRRGVARQLGVSPGAFVHFETSGTRFAAYLRYDQRLWPTWLVNLIS